VCRRYRISEGTIYKYKSKYGGIEPSEAKRLRALEDENAKLTSLPDAVQTVLEQTEVMLREVAM
jgi:hypothetical protein